MVRRAFPVMVLALLGASAYFSALGASALVERTLLRVFPKTARQELPADTAAAKQVAARTSVILSRNPFDSQSVPLEPRAPAPAVLPERVEPLTAPDCPEIRVFSTLIAERPEASSAVIRGPGEARGRVLRVGAYIGEFQVVFIGENPLRLGPTVWLEGPSGLCQSALFADKTAAVAPIVASPPPQASVAPSKEIVPEQIWAKIQRVDADEFVLERSAVEAIMSNYAQLLRGSRVVPAWRGGELTGFRLDSVPPDNVLGRLGFQKGDQIESINGQSIATPEKALEAYANLRSASELRVRVLRGGQPLTIEYRIR